MAEPIVVPEFGTSLIKDGKATIIMHTWMAAVSDQLNTPPITGSGSPEGVVVASVGRWYVNTAAAAGTGIYFKETGDENTGWVLRS